MPKGCAHIASTESTEYPEPRNQGGVISYPIRKIWGELIYICSTGVISFWNEKQKDYILTQIMHRNLYEISTSDKQKD